jgi:hypothetical protein
VALVVVNPQATDALKQRMAREVGFVVRHAPHVYTEAEAKLGDTIAAVRRNFMTRVRKSDFDSPDFSRVVAEIAASAPPFFPFDTFAPLWGRGEPSEAVVNELLQPLRAVLSQPIVNSNADTLPPANELVRLVAVEDLDAPISARELEQRGEVVPAGKVLNLLRARRMVETHFPPGQETMGRFAASFLRSNSVPDSATTELLRAKQVDGVAVNDSYDPGQVVVRKGQMIDRRALSVLAVMREKSMIGMLQSRLEHEETRHEQEQSIANLIRGHTRWFAAGLALAAVLPILILLKLRSLPSTAVTRPSRHPALHRPNVHALPSGHGDDSWRERALLAEGKAERAQQAIRSGVIGWLREKIVRTLFRQRAELLSAQQKAEAEMLELEQRLEHLHAPLQERITAYEQRIAGLEKDLAAKGEENRKLIGARIHVARQHLDVERERRRFVAN